MNTSTNYQQNQNSSPKVGTDNFTTEVLIPLGSVIIGVIGLLASANRLPAWASWTMVIYLVLIILKILARPIKNFTSKTINQFNHRRFVKKMQPKLLKLSSEFNELLDSQRTNTIPSFISQLFSKLSQEVNMLSCLGRNRQQFTILQSWAFSLERNLRRNNKTEFIHDAAQFSDVVTWFIWACVWVRETLDNKEVDIHTNKDIISDWNAATRRISDFTSRVERLMKSANEKFNTSSCATYFQDVKPL